MKGLLCEPLSIQNLVKVAVSSPAVAEKSKPQVPSCAPNFYVIDEGMWCIWEPLKSKIRVAATRRILRVHEALSHTSVTRHYRNFYTPRGFSTNRSSAMSPFKKKIRQKREFRQYFQPSENTFSAIIRSTDGYRKSKSRVNHELCMYVAKFGGSDKNDREQWISIFEK